MLGNNLVYSLSTSGYFSLEVVMYCKTLYYLTLEVINRVNHMDYDLLVIVVTTLISTNQTMLSLIFTDATQTCIDIRLS